MQEIEKWTTLKSELVFDHYWYKLRRDEVRLPNGQIIDDYFVSVRPEVAIVFPITADNEVIFVRQYKHGAGGIFIELPGGVFNSADEPAEVAALRELVEETGYTSSNVHHLATVYDNPTKDTNRIHMFLAEGVHQVTEQHLDATENIQIIKIPLVDIPGKIASGEINVAGSIAISFLAFRYLQQK